MFFSIKESFETTLRRRQEKQLEQAKMMKEMADKEAKDDEETEREVSKERKASSQRKRSAVATPGRANSTTPRFAPKSRGRLGL